MKASLLALIILTNSAIAADAITNCPNELLGGHSQGLNMNDKAACSSSQVFAPTSFWYQKIPANVQLATDSVELVKDLQRQITRLRPVVLVTSTFTAPVYFPDASVQNVPVKWKQCTPMNHTSKEFIDSMRAVPMPNDAKVSNGTDKEIAIYSKSQDRYWDMWIANKDADGTWTACHGGMIDRVSKSDGRFTGDLGAAATGLPFIGGQITAEELQRGEINHVMGISLIDATAFWKFSYPARRSDGNGKGLIAGGQRFRLNPVLDLSRYNLTPAERTIARAGQIYGWVVWDTAGNVSMRARNANSYPSDPYPALFMNLPLDKRLTNIPWEEVQFLPIDYGKP